jgi:3-hydroxyacyl-CoA dehydrogenase/enoyl-CoA hydratase/3-hydroxybutyryl-CoA epimerase
MLETNTPTMALFGYQQDSHGIVTITMDMDGPINCMNLAFMPMLSNTVEKLSIETGLTGVIIASAKTTFFAGGDLNWLRSVEREDAAEFMAHITTMKACFRQLEKLTVPVVAAINGSALGGGFEICLACNYRVAWQDSSVKLGLPEATLGLLPGGGGTVRMTHLLGLEKALPLLTEGQKMTPRKALSAGLINALVEHQTDLIEHAKNWILDHKNDPTSAQQPWDTKGHKIPGGSASHPPMNGKIAVASAQIQQKTRGLLPGPEMILDIMVEAARLDFDTAQHIETCKFVELVIGPVTKNIITAMFFNMNQVKGGHHRPQGFPRHQVKRLGIIGAGMMGQGIAYSAAMAGIQVHLKDTLLQSAEKGKNYSQKLLQKKLDQGRIDSHKMQQILALINPTDTATDLKGCDLIIEAVFEDKQLKDHVLQEHESLINDNGFWGTNTSTLPINLLAQKATNKPNFIGLHFFSPVDKMPLLEIICGTDTSDATLAKAFDFAKQINKLPIVVNDGLGFYTSRTINTKIDEALQMVAEGLDPVLVDNLGKVIGFPVGMLTLLDQLKLGLPLLINDTQVSMGLKDRHRQETPEGMVMLRELVEQHDRQGRINGRGFYTYDDHQRHIWPGLIKWLKPDHSIPHQDIKDRLLFRPVIETLRCLEEHVLTNVADANIASILGIGAPLWTGGYAQFVNTYGLTEFITRCDALAQVYGARFNAPDIVYQYQKLGKTFV